MRRPLIIGIIIVVILIIAGGLYAFFSSSAPGVAVTPGSSSLPLAQEGEPFVAPDVVPETPEGSVTSVSSRLTKISVGPVVPGMRMYTTEGNASSSPETTVSYIEQRSGNVFKYSLGARSITRTSNRTLPGIQAASWTPDGTLAFVQYLSGDDYSTVNTYALPNDGSDGYFLAQNIQGLAVSDTSVSTLASGNNGSVVSRSALDGSGIVELFTTPLSAVRFASTDSPYTLFTKPTGTLPGNVYFVSQGGSLSRVAGPLLGLSALASPSGDWVFVSFVRDGRMQTMLVDTTTLETVTLPIATIAEKCVWAEDEASLYCGVPKNPSINAVYPDDWYQGAVHFDDRIWRIQVENRYAQLVLDFSKETDTLYDIQSPTLDAAASTIVFINRNDGSLWSYAL